MGDDKELAALWRTVDELSAELAPADRRALRDVIANSVLEGHHSTAGEITNLVRVRARKDQHGRLPHPRHPRRQAGRC
ncbi:MULTISPECIES: hypothetical protein [Mycobacteriaceae]|uniref:hypothetical protein n=1 Tax=Mycobacteriaceae TaxID=1762 RepID=UPI000929C5A7|nr:MULTISPECIES: hypothetical protein [Mycobacteriaceae]MCA2261606.1 hypothetical protein [Mycobacterium avium]MEE3755451.1 hypothetical protein [Mycobacterium intracellulare]QWY65501.1 hypothetical protein BJP78_27770 [Mycobacterium avium subsp. hominissuis]SIK26904.1 Uncharacterised protein [Mycobacteroides abscessus subsp. abscessus]SIL69202.1 Uncharacterised protein [Mycobacteroides abscessus subsp. abscessus]